MSLHCCNIQVAAHILVHIAFVCIRLHSPFNAFNNIRYTFVHINIHLLSLPQVHHIYIHYGRRHTFACMHNIYMQSHSSCIHSFCILHILCTFTPHSFNANIWLHFLRRHTFHCIPVTAHLCAFLTAADISSHSRHAGRLANSMHSCTLMVQSVPVRIRSHTAHINAHLHAS